MQRVKIHLLLSRIVLTGRQHFNGFVSDICNNHNISLLTRNKPIPY